MSLKLCNVIKFSKRKISFSNFLLGKNQVKLKVKVDLDSSSQVKSMEAIAKKNRELWEKRNSELNAVAGKVCFDDVFFMKEYEALKYPLSDAISMHKEYCLDTAMLDAPYAILKANFVFNMAYKKGVKFLSKIEGCVIAPHEMEFEPKKKVLAFCKTPEDITLAMEAGAIEAGSDAVVSKLQSGLLNYEEFDQVVCNLDGLPFALKVRPILRDKMVLRTSIRCGTDIKNLVHSFTHGYEYESKKLDGVQEETQLTVPLGEISWPQKSLEENFVAFITDFVENASNNAVDEFIVRCSLTCAPSDETFLVDIAEMVTRIRAAKKPQPRKTTLGTTESLGVK